jgi:hypothetical protein
MFDQRSSLTPCWGATCKRVAPLLRAAVLQLGPDRTLTVHAALDRPRLWRFTAALSALLLCGLMFICAQGSLRIIARNPTGGSLKAASLPSWEPWCTRGVPRTERKRLAFCARVEGRVLTSTHGPKRGEAHLALISDFHVVLVRLPIGEVTPKRGANIVAVGPLFRARDGQREVQAFWYHAT